MRGCVFEKNTMPKELTTEGAIYEDPAFFSTTTSHEVATKFATPPKDVSAKDVECCMIYLRTSSTGINIKPWSMYLHEDEYIFAPGTKWRVVSVFDDEDKKSIWLDEIPLYTRNWWGWAEDDDDL